MIIKNFKDYMDSLNEGLITTYDGEKAIEHLVNTLRILNFDVSGSFANGKIRFNINDFNHIADSKLDDFFDTISSIMVNTFGWFPSSMDITKINSIKNLKPYNESELKLHKGDISDVIIEFDSKFDEVITEHFGKLYHLSIKEYQKKILKYGLSPRSKSKLSSHIDRVYLCSSLLDCKSLIPQMKLHYSEEKDVNLYRLGNKKWRKNIEWIIFEIDNTSNIKLYKDTRYVNGYYTMDNISPDIITIKESE